MTFMRIGILTLPLHTNYGGILQAWALQTILERLGHSVEVFGIKQNGHHTILMPIVWSKRMFMRVIRHDKSPIFIENIRKKEHNIKYSVIDEFIKTRINSRHISSLHRLPYNDYDAIVVGSDQIWRQDYIKYLWHSLNPEQAFLSHIKDNDIKKIAYAASLGIDNWTYSKETTWLITESLQNFRAISVREISAIELIKKSTNITVDFVCDPTLLLDSSDYLNALDIKVKEQNEVVSYILDPSDTTEALKTKIANTRNVIIKEINCPNNEGAYPSVEQWIERIASAKMVITDSFHGCVFSIIFRRPLIFVKNSDRGNTRFDSLIDTFGLYNNIINDPSEYNIVRSYNLPSDIDERVTRLRDSSLNFLEKNLSC